MATGEIRHMRTGFGDFELSDVRSYGLRRIEVREPARDKVAPLGWLVQYNPGWQTDTHPKHTTEKPVLDAILKRFLEAD